MEALKNAIATSAASTGVASVEKLRELIAEFFLSPEGQDLVDGAIENYMSSAKGTAAIESAIVAAMVRREGKFQPGVNWSTSSRLSAARRCARR